MSDCEAKSRADGYLLAPGHILEVQPLDAPLTHEFVALDSDGIQGTVRGIVPEEFGWNLGMRPWRQSLQQHQTLSHDSPEGAQG